MRQIVLTEKAQNSLEKLLNYLQAEWSSKVKSDFVKKLDDSLTKVQAFPESFQFSELAIGLYRCVITKQTSIYYKFNATTITIVAIIDNRMNPTKLNKLVK